MGNPKQKWTAEEEETLRAGIAKYGPGKWKLILADPLFHGPLRSRSNIDLKDKWRNINAAVQGSRDKSRTPKPTQDAPATPLTTPVPIVHESPAQHVKDDSAKDLPDGENGPRYNKVNFEAVSAGKEQSGSDIRSTSSYIEQRIEEPQNFGKPLGATLETLVQQDKLEKDDSHYWLMNNPMETNTSNQKQKVGESLEEAAKTAASKVVEAETKSYVAAEAVKEAEKFSKLAEETDSILQFAKEIFDRCTHGETVLVA